MRYISTGCKILDKLMGGGFLASAINLIYGDPGSGKTTIILQTILNLSKNCEGEFFYLDTEQGFHESRLLQMAKALNIDRSILDRMYITRVDSLSEQHKTIIHKWEETIKNEGLQPLAFIVDSFVNQYHKQLLATKTSFLASEARELQGKLAYQAGKLMSLAIKYDVPVILVSWTKSAAYKTFLDRERNKMLKKQELLDLELGFDAKRFEVIGGSHLEYISKTILRLLILKDYKRLAILEKHIAMPTPKVVKLKMTEEGFIGDDEKIYELNDYWRKIIQET